jgi:hypothetical protein
MFLIVACGPGSRPQRSDATGEPAPCLLQPEGDVATCSDGLADCRDPNCSGIGACPACSMVEHSLPEPLPLPDGVSDGVACTTSNTCEATTPSCVANECHAAYTSTLHFAGFAPNQTFTDVSNIQRVCLTIEHSWLPDLEIVLRAPDGREVELARMPGRAEIPEVYLGQAYDCDTPAYPQPGVGADYCWTPTAANPSMITYVKSGRPLLSTWGCTNDGMHAELPPSDYRADGSWADLVGAPLDGDWSVVITDAWKLDNGYLFSWSIAFDPSLVQSCSGPIIQ